MDRGAPALPAANGPLAAVPRPRHTAALGVVGERTGPNVKLGERGASKGALQGMACWISGKERIPGYLGSAVVSDSVPTGQWFEPSLQSSFFSFFGVGFSTYDLFYFSGRCGYQVLSPKSYRLLVTIVLQGHLGSSGAL